MVHQHVNLAQTVLVTLDNMMNQIKGPCKQNKDNSVLLDQYLCRCSNISSDGTPCGVPTKSALALQSG